MDTLKSLLDVQKTLRSRNFSQVASMLLNQPSLSPEHRAALEAISQKSRNNLDVSKLSKLPINPNQNQKTYTPKKSIQKKNTKRNNMSL